MARIEPRSANDYDDRTTARAWLEVIHDRDSSVIIG